MVLDDVFVVPVPTTMKVTGFFRASGNSVIAPEARDDVARKLADAVNDALGECVKRDSDCHVVAIGPFSVGPN